VGSCGHLRLGDLVLDCSRKLVGLQSPATFATRAGGDSDPSLENYDLFHAQSPDTGRGVYARSWRANRDVDVRRSSLVLFKGALVGSLLCYSATRWPLRPTGERKATVEFYPGRN